MAHKTKDSPLRIVEQQRRNGIDWIYKLQQQYHFLWISWLPFWITVAKSNFRFKSNEWQRIYPIK